MSEASIALVSRDLSEAMMGSAGKPGLSEPRVACSSSLPPHPWRAGNLWARKPPVRASSWWWQGSYNVKGPPRMANCSDLPRTRTFSAKSESVLGTVDQSVIRGPVGHPWATVAWPPGHIFLEEEHLLIGGGVGI